MQGVNGAFGKNKNKDRMNNISKNRTINWKSLITAWI